MSELLCYIHPDTCMIWNRRAYVGFEYLGIEELPRYNYQNNGDTYVRLSQACRDIADELQNHGLKSPDLLEVDYFIWSELQVVDNLSSLHKTPTDGTGSTGLTDDETKQFIHNEVRDKIADIGRWLGFESDTEVKVADGSRVDTTWEAIIGNMGRVVYVFEVQTHGSKDSLIVNLLKSLNNPAVQGVVAVSDEKELEKIQSHSANLNFGAKLKTWNYQEVLRVHELLESANEIINQLGLVPQGF